MEASVHAEVRFAAETSVQQVDTQIMIYLQIIC